MTDKAFFKQKSPGELEQALVRQMSHLRISSKLYDEGNQWEAERLATAIYLICHDSGKNYTSVLKHVGIKEKILFPDTTSLTINTANSFSMTPPMLAHWKTAEGLSLNARLGDVNLMAKISFNKWWDQTVFTAENGMSMSRKNIVYRSRSKDGGAHVDATNSDEVYERLKTQSSHFTVTVNGSPTWIARVGNFTNGHWATIRQIAHELDSALAATGY